MLRCNDESLYTGVTTNITQRVFEHNNTAKGAKYTRCRRPVCLVYEEKAPSRSEACKREYQIKQMGKSKKEKMLLRVVQK